MKSRNRSRLALGVAGIVWVLCLLAPAAASAQTAELRGVVTDDTGGVLPGVRARRAP